ncbi:uncharacterized protein LOC116847745 [Odontomachus brunneus]|uniref:uncharacterized protein LOC116847745 n=1 Tax=Odontomachus brunneus TaxID=486640 RepID=UPI0013F2AA05|nr:uncharacterized protein LOC116847745 [Odontomachus brunneus]
MDVQQSVANAHRELRDTRAQYTRRGYDEEKQILSLSRCATILMHRRRRNVMTFSARMTSARRHEEIAKIAGTPNAPSGITPRPHHTPLVTAANGSDNGDNDGDNVTAYCRFPRIISASARTNAQRSQEKRGESILFARWIVRDKGSRGKK